MAPSDSNLTSNSYNGDNKGYIMDAVKCPLTPHGDSDLLGGTFSHNSPNANHGDIMTKNGDIMTKNGDIMTKNGEHY